MYHSLNKCKHGGVKYKGVHMRSLNRYTAEIRDPRTKKRVLLGVFDTPELAAYSYDFAAKTMRGTRARTNFFYANSRLCSFSRDSAATPGANFPLPFPADPTKLQGSWSDSAMATSVCKQPTLQRGSDAGCLFGDRATGNCIKSPTVQMEKTHQLVGDGALCSSVPVPDRNDGDNIDKFWQDFGTTDANLFSPPLDLSNVDCYPNPNSNSSVPCFSPSLSSSHNSSALMNNPTNTVITTPVFPNHCFLPEESSFPNNTTINMAATTPMPGSVQNYSFFPLSNQSCLDNNATTNVVSTTKMLAKPIENYNSLLPLDPGLGIFGQGSSNSLGSNPEHEIENNPDSFYPGSDFFEQTIDILSNMPISNSEQIKKNVGDSLYLDLDLFEQNNSLVLTNSIAASSTVSGPKEQQEHYKCDRYDISQSTVSHDEHPWREYSEIDFLLEDFLESIPDIPSVTTLSEL